MSRKKHRLSAVVIAKNEKTRIAKCLSMLGFADEIIVVDNDSTDTTAEIAKKHGATVAHFPSDDFSKLRNIAASIATGEWVLYVDADETVTTELARDIQTRISSWKKGEANGYEVHRKNYYLGVLWPAREWMLRLFRRDALKAWQGHLHETPLVCGDIGRLRGDLLHDTHRSLTQMVTKTNEWSEMEAMLRKSSDHPPVTWWRIIRVMLTGFWESYIHQGGWRIGTVGWIESLYQGFSLFITYAKLWELQQKTQRSKSQ